jgi:hypothetical protein
VKQVNGWDMDFVLSRGMKFSRGLCGVKTGINFDISVGRATLE